MESLVFVGVFGTKRGPVLFLARGRGAVAAGGFISCQPHRVFITNCQARSLILGG